MADTIQGDWRVTEGPAIGAEPEFELSDIQLRASFHGDGSVSRSVDASLTSATPTLVESLGRTLPQLSGILTIFDYHPERTVLFPVEAGPVDLGSRRGVLGLAGPDRYLVRLFLPPDQFAMLLPLFAPPPPTARLRIEVNRSLHQAVFEPADNFWNDRQSPAVLFDQFEIMLPDHNGRYT